MKEVTTRDLRNRGGEVLNRVLAGESLLVTRSGDPVAELIPVRRNPLGVKALVEGAKKLPKINPDQLREDIDSLIDPRL